jgi:type IV secretory pathway TraG/TraD family ATPase VirD4
MFTDKVFRRTVMQSVTDPQVLAFWKDEYPKMNYRGAFDGVAPIANKLGAFLSNPIVRKALCDPEQPIRLRQVMDAGTPLVINLAKGRLGSHVADVLGGLVLSLMAQAAYTRVSIRLFERRPFIIFADEFHNFTTDSTASMLSELRKFKVGLVLAGQYTSQIERTVLDAILGNVGTLMCFRIGAQDAALISRQFGSFESAHFVGLPNYRMFVRLMVKGTQTDTFSAQTLA